MSQNQVPVTGATGYIFGEFRLKHRVGGPVQARCAQIDAVKLVGKK